MPDFTLLAQELGQQIAERMLSRSADAGADSGLALARKILFKVRPRKDAKPAPIEKRDRAYREFRDAVIAIRILFPVLVETDNALAGTWASPLHNSYMALLPDRFSRLTTTAVDLGLVASPECLRAARDVTEQMELVFGAYPRRAFRGLGRAPRVQRLKLTRHLESLDEALMRFTETAGTEVAV